MARIGGQCRALWNHWVAENKDRYGREKKFKFFKELCASVRGLRQYPEFFSIPGRCAQEVAKHLDRALQNCTKTAKNRKNFPKFKKKGAHSDAFHFVGAAIIGGCEKYKGKIRIPLVGLVRVRGLKIPRGARITRVAIYQAPSSTGWEICVQHESAPRTVKPPLSPVIGIDFGLTSAITTSDGAKFSPLKPYRRHLKRLKKIQRAVDRSRDGSVNKRRKTVRLGRFLHRSACQRRDWQQKLTSHLITKHAGVAVETLSMAGLCGSRLSRSFYDVGIGTIRRHLQYKCDWYGREFKEFPMFRRSTGVCPDCGHVGPKLPLSARTWQCSGCSLLHDRDTASARIVLNGCSTRGSVSRGTREPGPKDQKARFCQVLRGPLVYKRFVGTEPPSKVPLPVHQNQDHVFEQVGE